jgi:hypothetical protein
VCTAGKTVNAVKFRGNDCDEFKEEVFCLIDSIGPHKRSEKLLSFIIPFIIILR